MKAPILLLFIFPFSSALGQGQTYLGMEIGPKFEVYDFSDNGNGLYTRPFFFSPIYGLTIGHEINEFFMIESGVYHYDYGQSYRIKGEASFVSSNAILAYQIPLRLRAVIPLVEDRLRLLTTVGYSITINSSHDSSGSGSSFTSGSLFGTNDSTRTQDVSDYSLERAYGLIETGVALEYQLRNSLVLHISTNYMTGLKRIVEINVRYWIDDGPEQSGQVFSKGDYYSIVFGLKYPINNLLKPKGVKRNNDGI